jgi:hypothetical protein
MPLSHFSKVFAVSDAKVAKMLTDVSGGAATYSTSIDVPGIKSVEISGDIESKELRGDNALMDRDAVISNVSATVEHAKLSLDMLSAMLGGTVTDAGTTPNQTSVWDLTATSKPVPFRLEAVSASSDSIGGQVRFTLHKAILDSFPDMGLAEEDYRTSSFDVGCMPLLATGRKWMSIEFQETAVALT